MKKVLVIYAHPDEKSFNAALLERTVATIKESGHHCIVIDLYKDGYDPVLTTLEMRGGVSENTKAYQRLIKSATDIIFIFPVWWFRSPAIMEGFIDKTFVPKFAYRFKQIIGKYGMPIPMLKDKNVLTFITHGAPALPVKTLYVNVVKYRFLLGFLGFCFNVFKCTIVQLWSVPFISDAKRNSYLDKVERIVKKRLGKADKSDAVIKKEITVVQY